MALLTGTTLGPTQGFNWPELLSLLICGILAIFFLFYFNRLFATLVSYGIRAWTWHKYRAYVDITSLQISLLGGRIFFKGIRYHAHNITVLVHDGQITWRYWLGNVQDAIIFSEEDARKRTRPRSPAEKMNIENKDASSASSANGPDEEEGAPAGNLKKLPCRISVKVSGVEAFIYNRSPAYDSIVEAFKRKAGVQGERQADPHTPTSSTSSSSAQNRKEEASPASAPQDTDANSRTARRKSIFDEEVMRAQLPFWLRILPILVECRRAAAAIGNQHTKSIITAKVERAVGTIDAGASGALDLFKLLFDFEFDTVHVAMKPNRDYKLPQLQYAEQVLRSKEDGHHPKTAVAKLKVVRKSGFTWLRRAGYFRNKRVSGGSLRTASTDSIVDHPIILAADQLPEEAQWEGLKRYLDDRIPTEHDEWTDVEYAKSSTLVDCPKVSFRFYWDIPGKVPDHVTLDGIASDLHETPDINGSSPPAYGIDIGVYGGSIVYGPWADRQRVNLQQVFFPVACVDASPAQRLKPGDWRVSTIFKIYVCIEEDVVLRVPTREPSKDKRWQGRADGSRARPARSETTPKSRWRQRSSKRTTKIKGNHGVQPVDVRPYGWLDITIKADSTVNYTMDMFPGQDRFRNGLDLDVKGTEMTSSVNHGMLWRTGALTLNADISNPLGWNALRKWPFTIVCHDLELFIIRDHMFLITDIVNDWSGGPPPEFYSFIPYVYNLNLTFHNFALYLNTNDANIISNPAELDYNDFLTLEGRSLHGVLAIPLEFYRPKQSGITFDVVAENLLMRILSPARSTFRELVREKQVAELPRLTMSGSYSAHSDSRPGLTDLLRMDITGTGLNLKAHGFLVRHFINLKENYFGDYLHFKTMEEFQEAGEDLQEANEKTATVVKPQSINELDVILCITAEDATLLLPTNIYSCKEFVKIELPHANLDLRVVSYYLDMGLSLAPISFFAGRASPPNSGDSSPVEDSSRTQLWIGHVELNGHRAFGLPPTEPAYACTWEVDVGPIKGECSDVFIRDLVAAGRTFLFSFQDLENALPLVSPNTFYDITFARVRVDATRIWVRLGDKAILVELRPISVDTNDWAHREFSQRICVLVPLITVACIDTKDIFRHENEVDGRVCVPACAYFQTGAAINLLGRKQDFANEQLEQQRYLREHDIRTNRATFLQLEDAEFASLDYSNAEVDPPYMPQVSLPFPVDKNGDWTSRPASIKSCVFTNEVGAPRRNSSAPSVSSSIKSILRPADVVNGMAEDVYHTSHLHTQIRSLSLVQRNTAPDERPFDRNKPNLRTKFGFGHPDMKFASPFSEPHFAFQRVIPDDSRSPRFPSHSDVPFSSSIRDIALESQQNLWGDDEASSSTSILVELRPGIRAYVEPAFAETVIDLLTRLLPERSEDILDGLQMQVLNDIAGAQRETNKKDNIIQVSVVLPIARLRIANPFQDDTGADLLDANICYLQQMVRMRTKPSDDNESDLFALRTSIDEITIEAYERLDAIDQKPAVALSVRETLLWTGVAAKQSFHASIRSTTLFIAGDQTDRLFLAALRLIPKVRKLITEVNTGSALAQSRLLFLIFYLTTHSEDITDPPFISRMIFILRAFPNHFRNQESWKVIARFRYILTQLDRESWDDLEARIRANRLDCPEDVESQVLHSWAQWRNWDVPNVSQTAAFQTVFGQSDARVQTYGDKATTVNVDLETLRISIGQGAHTSHIILDDASLGLESNPPTVPTGLMLAEENTRTYTVVHIHAPAILLNVDWSICEVLQSALPLEPRFAQLFASFQKDPAQEPLQRTDTGIDRHDFHVVLTIDSGAVNIQSINLQYKSEAAGLQLSVIGSTQANDQYGYCASALLNADVAKTELRTSRSCIWQTVLTSPSIYVDHRQPLQALQLPPIMTLACAYDDIEIKLVEQIPGILHVIDSVIVDEVPTILDLMQGIQTGSVPQSDAPDATHGSSIPAVSTQFVVAVLSGRLHMEVSLLQSLSYHLQGSAASLRITPKSANDAGRCFDIAFDMGRQSHSLINSSANVRHQESILELPPINGLVDFNLGSNTTSISITCTVQKIEVEAMALQHIMAVVNQPEVQQVFMTIKTGIGDISNSVSNLDLHHDQPEADERPSMPKPILFDVRFALLGIRIAASTAQVKGRSTAEIEFGIGPLHLKASNRSTFSARNPLIPAIQASVRDIGARLWIQDGRAHMPCGSVLLALDFRFDTRVDTTGRLIRDAKVQSNGLEFHIYPETASTAVDVINRLQDRIRDLDLSKEVEYLRHLRDTRRDRVIRKIKGVAPSEAKDDLPFSATTLLASTTTMVQLVNIKAVWHVAAEFSPSASVAPHHAVLSLSKVEFTTKGANEARLLIIDLMLQLETDDHRPDERSPNSALLPEVSFSVAYWSVGRNGSVACKASGMPLDLRLDSRFLLPTNGVYRSANFAIEKFKSGTATWKVTPTSTGAPRKKLFDTKTLAAVLVEADFEGAQVYMQGLRDAAVGASNPAYPHVAQKAQRGRYGQFAPESGSVSTTLQSPGIALKVEYNSTASRPTVHGELRIDASSNMLLPNVVPLILEVSNSVKEIVQKPDETSRQESHITKPAEATAPVSSDTVNFSTDPTAIFGKTKVDFGLRVCRQEFGLSCQPIARVDAKAVLEDFYFTVNTIDSADDHGHFYAMSAVVTKLTAQVKHMYSREPTFIYDMDSIVLSLMNSKHLSGTNGISAILEFNPTRIAINAKQLQDLLLFQEIWLPPEIREPALPGPNTANPLGADEYLVQKYQLVAAAAAFPWNATIAIAELAVDLDLGQSIGKSSFVISNLWACQQKSSDWEQDLCIGLDNIAINSTGRMSGFIDLNGLRVRTSIKWPQSTDQQHLTPLIQASVGLHRLRAKAAFDYQAFAFGDIEQFDFMMYNVRRSRMDGSGRDRLAANLNFGKAFVFCTSTSAAQAVGLYQAFDRLVQEKQAAYTQSLREIEKHLRRESSITPNAAALVTSAAVSDDAKETKPTISLHTDVIVTLGALSFGVFPSTFFDSQLLKIEANNIEARFAVGPRHDKIHSALGVELGQLQVALAAARRMTVVPKALDVGVDEVISSALNAKGGTILRVPRVEALMETWHSPNSNTVEYIFESLFDGKIDVGWNLSRINFIQSMWTAHARTLASRLGKALPESAVKITATPAESATAEKQERIMAEVSLPQSRYNYQALRPPVIETPQLRDMGEATPPLEWIGLHRDRLPNVTHQIIIVSLLEVAKEVEDAYERILGSSAK